MPLQQRAVRRFIPAPAGNRSTSSFGRDDILVLAKVADLAHTRIHQLQREGAKSQND